jgi:hypothetical protein
MDLRALMILGFVCMRQQPYLFLAPNIEQIGPRWQIELVRM